MKRIKHMAALAAAVLPAMGYAQDQPNVIIIYADDLGLGDLSCYGAKHIKTPHIDHLAERGLRFSNAHSPSATSTPSRYAMLTGQYAWRNPDTGIAPGDQRLLLDTQKLTLPKLFQQAQYHTAVIGKWHLGLGAERGKQDWNKAIHPGPKEVGFDYSFIIPATGDRTPCVFMENQQVVGLEASDPLFVSYSKPFEGEPLAKDHVEQLRHKFSHGHNQALINGIGRIGYMKGAKKAEWKDEDIAQTLVGKSINYIRQQKEQAFFLYLATHDIHVPRFPNQAFIGKSGLGNRGDAILQLDWTVGQIQACLEQEGLTDKTIIILASDNGATMDDGYQDQSVHYFKDKQISGGYRGEKGTAWEGGTRTPMIISYPGTIQAGSTSKALCCHIDFLASFASMLGQAIPQGEAADSQNQWEALTGQMQEGREGLVVNNGFNILSYTEGDWKYIEAAGEGVYISEHYGSTKEAKLYNLAADPQEKVNLAPAMPQKRASMEAKLAKIKDTL